MAKTVTIDAKGMNYTELNTRLRAAASGGVEEVTVNNVLGQRFIADGLRGSLRIVLNGVPGGDLGMFMSGPTCIVHGNCEHAPGNTMDSGKIIIHGSAGDAVAHSMRGGLVYVRDDIGYRGGIHMKEYQDKRPILVVGGSARAFLGEYMAGGLILVLGRNDGEPVTERGIGSGIHGGEIYIRGHVNERFLGTGAMIRPCGVEQKNLIASFVQDFCEAMGLDPEPFLNAEFTRIGPMSSRPFAGKYTWE